MRPTDRDETPPNAPPAQAPDAAPHAPEAAAAPAASGASDAPAAGAEVVRLSLFRGHLAQALTRRGKALLARDDLATEVAAMAPTELYFTIKELGVDEAAPLLHAATPEQFQSLCDLDCWDSETFVAEELDAWLAPFLAEGEDALAERFLQLDEEVQVLFLQGSLRVLDMREQDGSKRKVEDVPWPTDVAEDAPWKTTPEGFFTLIDTSRDREVPPLVLVDALRNADANECFRLLTAARWELQSPLMEQGQQFREGRLLDQGFVPPHEALRLFANPPPLPAALRPDHAGILAAGATVDGDGAAAADGDDQPALQASVVDRTAPRLPALYAAALTQAPCAFVAAMGAVVDAATLADLEAQLVALLNGAVSAYGQRPKDLTQVQAVAGYVRDTLSLGLHQLQAATPQAGAAVLRRLPLAHLFGHGVAAVRPLQRRAATACAAPNVAAWLAAAPVAEADPEAADRHFLRALADVRPLWAGVDGLRPERRRAWQRPEDVAATAERLTALLARLSA